MKQRIVISPTVIESMAKYSRLEFTDKVLPHINTLLYLFDKNRSMYTELSEAIISLDKSKIDPTVYEYLKLLYTMIGDRSVCNEKTYCVKRSSKTWHLLESEQDILLNEFWKIIVAENINPRIIKEASHEDIEISSLANFHAPSAISQIRRVELIDEVADKNFNLASWILKYIIDAKVIIIEDPFIGSDESIDNLENILKKLHPKTLVYLKGRGRKMSEQPYIGMTNKEKLKRLKSKYSKLTIKIVELRQSSDRRITTDDFVLILDHSMRDVDPVTNKIKKNILVSANIRIGPPLE